MFAAADNAVELPAFTRVDAGVFYTPNERLRLQLNVENLLDETYYPNAHNNNNITPGSPLAIRAGVTARF
jgi:catecholate siderophore receptor